MPEVLTQADKPTREQWEHAIEQLADRLTSQCTTHEEWLTVMRYGMGTLTEHQPLLIYLIHSEAKREVHRGSGADIALQRIFAELKLKITAT